MGETPDKSSFLSDEDEYVKPFKFTLPDILFSWQKKGIYKRRKR